MLGDSNPMVIANAVAALSEINYESTNEQVFTVTNLVSKLLAALNECTEWGRICIFIIFG
jgi:vesicle coat complex subunit